MSRLRKHNKETMEASRWLTGHRGLQPSLLPSAWSLDPHTTHVVGKTPLPKAVL